MGVLSARLHGPITAITAMATATVLPELPDNSTLRSFCNATGQTLLRTSLYAPTVTSVFDADLPLTTHTVSVPTMTSESNVMQISSFASQSSGAIRFYKPTQAPLLASQSSPLVLRFSHSMLKQSHQSPVFQSLELCGSKAWNSFFIPRHLFAGQASISQMLQEFQFGAGINVNSPFASTALLHTWHSPFAFFDSQSNALDNHKISRTVVLLGWLGAEQKHLKKYADWYTSKGMHVITFIVPMKDILSLEAVDKAEKHVDILTENLIQWLREDEIQGDEKQLIFHTFSNTGWLTYGAVLERLITQEDKLLHKIKGCIVDSAPSAKPDPQVWASGFSAALLKKGSVATQKLSIDDGSSVKPSLKETALLAMLEKFFSVVLQVPYVNRRLNDVISVLSNQQPACPQLYIYSSADTVIPARSVEAFIEEQKKAGRMVKSCNFQCSPHVDHFRTYPEKYTEQLTSFLKVCMPQWMH